MPDNDDQIHPVINVEEFIGKQVGRRKPRRGLTLEGSRIRDMIAWRKAFGGVGVPKGAFRFNSHEEADHWMTQQLATSAAKRS